MTIAAPFGAHGINLAANTTAICIAEEAHPQRAGRWIVGMFYTGFYLFLALLAPVLVRHFWRFRQRSSQR